MPNALNYGVSYELFWKLNPTKLQPFKMAYMKRIAEIDRQNWTLGIYIQHSVASCLGKNHKYPESPLFQKQIEEYEENIGLTQEEIDDKEIRKMIEQEDLGIQLSSNLPVPKLI